MVKILLGLCLAIIVFALYLVQQKISKAQYYIAQRVPKRGEKKTSLHSEAITEQRVLASEQQLFDDAAQLFLQRPPYSLELSDAQYIQDELLKKMPAQTVSQIRHLDLDEWSIYWSLQQQSLEYYVGSYGVFYAHVDRFGQEHSHVVQLAD